MKIIIVAHILYKNHKAKEIYLANGEIVGSKYLLIVYDNDDILLEWCYEDIVEIQVNPSITKIGRRVMVEYGEPNLFQIRRNLPFQDEQGNLEKIWEKIM